MKASEKKKEIVLLNVLLCLLVIFIHVSGEPVSVLERKSIQYFTVMLPWRLSAFVVQGFIFLSALKLFLKPIEDFSYKRFILNRIKTILIPYIFWVFLYYIYFVYEKHYFLFSYKDFLTYLINGTIVSPFYFIVTIVQFYILMPLWVWLIKRFDRRILLAASLLIMISSKLYLPTLFGIIGFEFKYFDRIFITYLFYWIMGCCAGKDYHAFRLYVQKYSFSELLMFLCAGVFDILLSYRAFIVGEYIPYLEYVHIFYCITAIIFCFSIAFRLKDLKILESSIIRKIDSASYYIFLIHCYILNRVNDVLLHYGITDIGRRYIIRIFLVYIISLIVPIIYVTIKKCFKSFIKPEEN